MNRPHSQLQHLLSARWLRWALLLGVLIAIAQIADPLANATGKQTALFWSGRILAFLLSVFLAEWSVDHFLKASLVSPPWLKPAVLVALVAVIPLSAAEIALERVAPQRLDYDDSALFLAAPVLAWLSEYLTIATILVPLNFVLWLLIDRPQSLSAGGEVLAETQSYRQPEFLAKTSGIQLETVIALEAEEHYIRVHRQNDSELIHHRLSDAAAEMPKALGLRVHRSWWVAERAVAAAQRGARRYQLTLSNGLTVPVSDSFMAAARERGLLAKRQPVSPR